MSRIFRMTFASEPPIVCGSPSDAHCGGENQQEAPWLGGSLVAALDPDPFVYQDSTWCANCGGRQTFVPVDRFIGGWRGYCLGCEQEKFVMVSRAESEAA